MYLCYASPFIWPSSIGHTEKTRVEAEIKAAEEAFRRKELDDLRMRRERERKAARMALEKVHNSFIE